MITRLTENEGYATVATIVVPQARVFEALTTIGGLAGWWTPDVKGVPLAGRRADVPLRRSAGHHAR